jgi:peptide/nickel transport system substrate-binding protein
LRSTTTGAFSVETIPALTSRQPADPTVTRRRFLNRSLASSAALLASPVVLSACAGATASSPPPSGPPRRGGRAMFARLDDAISVDPTAVADNESIWLVSNLFERLYQSSAHERGNSVPCLATGYALSADRLTWRFTLRDGVRFSNGEPLTSADVKFSIDRNTHSAANGYMNVAIASVDAPDKRTVEIRTKYPTDLLGVVSFYGNGVVPRDFGGVSAKEFFARPVSTGAFAMTRWTVGQQMVLTRNAHYWRAGKPYLDAITLTVLPDENARMLQLRGQQADIVEQVPFSQVSSVRAEAGLDVVLAPSTWMDFLILNERFAPLADVSVRDAISLAIDRNSIIKLALFGYGQPAGTMFAPSWPDYDSALTAPARDPSRARALLKRSAYPKGFHLTHSIESGDATQATAAQIIESNLGDVGISVSIQEYDPNALFNQINDGSFQMAHADLSLDIMDPVENVPYMVDPHLSGGLGESAHYRDPAVLTWDHRAQHSTDAVTVRRDYLQVQRILRRDGPFIPLYYPPYSYGTLSRVQGFVVPPTGDYRLEDVWLAA